MSLSPWLRPLVLLSLTCWHFDHARTATAGTVYNVSAGDDFFSPASVTLLTGDQVKWTWTGVHSHNTTSDTALWGSATLGNGSTFTETFNTAGFFPYRCTIHAPMLASVTVNATLPTVQITFPGNNATFAAPAKFKLQATASVPNGTISKVAFSQGNTLLVTDTTFPYSVSVSNLAIGHYTFSAVATDNQNRKVTNSIAVTVVRDTVRPTLTILKPLPLQRVTNTVADVTVMGTTSDNVSVTNVQLQINGGDWATTTTTNDFAKWSALVTPVAGTNLVNAYATDFNGNTSLTGRVRFVYVVPSTLTLVTNGIGGISRGFKGNQLEVGRAYTLTAVPGAGQILSSWAAGGVVSSSPVLQFIMQSNLVITANFIPNPFISAQGRYRGLFSEPVRAQTRSGFFSMALTDQGAYSASLKVGTNLLALAGEFDVSGNATNNFDGVDVAMHIDLGGSQKVTGTITTSIFVAELLANHCTFTLSNPATALKGAYTLIVPGAAGSTTTPAGHGYAAVTVGLNGSLTMAGTLADNAAWSQALPLSSDGQWACYVPLYGGLGSIWGWLQFDTNQPITQINGNLDWIRPAIAGGRYPLGFTNDAAVAGARYTAPTNSATRVIGLTNAIVAFADGNLSGPFTNSISFGPGIRVTNLSANALTMSLVRSNGLYSGSVKVPGVARTNNYKGAFLQDLGTGYGFFMGPSLSGSVFVGPEP